MQKNIILKNVHDHQDDTKRYVCIYLTLNDAERLITYTRASVSTGVSLKTRQTQRKVSQIQNKMGQPSPPDTWMTPQIA